MQVRSFPTHPLIPVGPYILRELLEVISAS